MLLKYVCAYVGVFVCVCVCVCVFCTQLISTHLIGVGKTKLQVGTAPEEGRKRVNCCAHKQGSKAKTE